MNSQNPRYFKNPARNQPSPSFQPYIPQYQQLGVSPASSGKEMSIKEEMATKAPPFAAYVLPKQRTNRSLPTAQNVPYAEIGQPSFGGEMGGTIPNIGNNNERTWSGMDQMIVDDLSDDVHMRQPMIDNNDYVQPTHQTANQNYMQMTPLLPSMLSAREYRTEAANTHQETVTVCDTSQLNISYEEYILIFKDEIILTGSLELVQEKVQELVLDSVFVDELVVLKRVKIKVGVFIE